MTMQRFVLCKSLTHIEEIVVIKNNMLDLETLVTVERTTELIPVSTSTLPLRRSITLS